MSRRTQAGNRNEPPNGQKNGPRDEEGNGPLSPVKPDDEGSPNQFTQISTIILMVAILVVAGAVSAITAMRFAIRGKEVAVPSLVGMTETEARQALTSSNLLLRVTGDGRFSTEIPAGHIIEQDPRPGSILKTSRSVKVLLSSGERKYAVPNLVGSTVRAAQLTLAQRYFALGNTTVTRTPKGDPLTIQQQSPLPGTQEGADPKINVLVSLGPFEQSFVMPDLIGRPAELVASRARSEGFKVARPTYRKYAGVEPGVVILQKPEAGNRLSKNDVIVLEVSQ